MEIKTMTDLNTWADSVDKRLEEKWAKTFTSTDKPDLSKAHAALGALAKSIAKNDREALIKFSMASKADLGTPIYSDATTGSYLVGTEITKAIEWAAYQNSVLLPLVTHSPMKNRQKLIPVADTMVSLTWQGAQSSAYSEVNPTFTQKTLTAYSVGAWCGMSESLLEDDDTGLGAYLAESFGSYLGYELDYQMARGVTTPWNGILTDAGKGVVLSTGNTEFTDVGWDDLVEAIEELGSERWLKGASFVFHPSVVAALRTKKNANGDYILRESLSDSNVPRFLGYPVYGCDAMPSTSDVSTAFGVFGNLKYFTLGDRVPMTVEKFDQTTHRVEYEEILYRARGRYAGAVTIPNAFVKISTAAS